MDREWFGWSMDQMERRLDRGFMDQIDGVQFGWGMVWMEYILDGVWFGYSMVIKRVFL